LKSTIAAYIPVGERDCDILWIVNGCLSRLQLCNLAIFPQSDGRCASNLSF
jgi:hypothetical protein